MDTSDSEAQVRVDEWINARERERWFQDPEHGRARRRVRNAWQRLTSVGFEVSEPPVVGVIYALVLLAWPDVDVTERVDVDGDGTFRLTRTHVVLEVDGGTRVQRLLSALALAPSDRPHTRSSVAVSLG